MLIQLVPMDWAQCLENPGILSLLYMSHFSNTTEVNTCMKKLLVCFHGGYLWFNNHIFVDVDLIAIISGFPKARVDPTPFFAGKEQDKILVA